MMDDLSLRSQYIKDTVIRCKFCITSSSPMDNIDGLIKSTLVLPLIHNPRQNKIIGYDADNMLGVWKTSPLEMQCVTLETGQERVSGKFELWYPRVDFQRLENQKIIHGIDVCSADKSDCEELLLVKNGDKYLMFAGVQEFNGEFMKYTMRPMTNCDILLLDQIKDGINLNNKFLLYHGRLYVFQSAEDADEIKNICEVDFVVL